MSISVPGYRDLWLQATHGEVTAWRGVSTSGDPVIIYTHTSELPTPAMRDRLTERADVARLAGHPAMAGFVELLDLPTRAALVVGAISAPVLADVPARSLSTIDVLQVAIDLAPALAELHVHGVGHGGVGLHRISLAHDEATIAAPWFDHAVAAPTNDLVDLARLVETMLLRAGLRVPQGVRSVLDAATSADPTCRYRSVIGFANDLGRCRDELRITDMCSPFPLAVADYALSWRDPQQAVGVEPQLDKLAERIESTRVAGVPSVLVLEGPSGAGRTALLTSYAAFLRARSISHGIAQFLPGGERLPLAALRELVASAIDELSARPAELRERLTATLRAGLGGDAAMAVRLAPALAQLLGQQPEATDGSALDVAARAERAAKAIAGAFASEGPFVVLLDDVEGADAASLDVLSVLARLAQPVLVVVARRTDADTTALLDVLEVIAAGGTAVRSLPLPPVDRSTLHQIVSDGLGLSDGAAAPLANALWTRSGGNPGLAIADLHSLIAKREVRVDPRLGTWSWSPAALVEAAPVGVGEVMLQRVQRISPAQRQVLQAAALAGRVATPSTIAHALGRTPETVNSLLDRLHADQFLEWRSVGVVRFHDDSLRRAAVESLDGTERGALRLRLARAVIAQTEVGGQPSDTERFDALRLLEGHEHALTDSETEIYLSWCEEAARTAHRAGGYAGALDLQLRALSMVGPLGWQRDAERTFELHLRAAENALVVGRTTLVDQLLDTAWAHHPTAQQRVRALRVLGNRWWTRQDQSGGLAEMHSILRELGERLPAHPSVAHVAREYLSTRRVLRHRSPESFLDAAPLTDERVRASLDTMLGAVHLAYTAEPLTHAMMVLRGIRLTAKYGVCAASSYFVAGYGLLLCGLGRDLPLGIGFGRAGVALAERSERNVQTMVCFAHNGFVRHWGEPLHTTIEPLIAEYRDGLLVGRGGYAHTGGTFAVLHALLSSRPLARVDELADELTQDLERLGEGAFAQRVKLVGQAVADLRSGFGDGGVGSSGPIDGALFSAPTWAAAKPRRGEFALMVHTVGAFVAMAADQLEVAADEVRAAAPHVRSAPGETIVGLHSFQLTVLARLVKGIDRGDVRRAERRLRRMARSNPHDYGHRVALLDALDDRRRGDGSGGDTARFEVVAAAARANDALADLCLIAHLAARSASRADEQAQWHSMATAALRAWGAEGLVRGQP